MGLMKKLLGVVVLSLLWSSIGYTVDQRIMGGEVKPHVIFRCVDINDYNSQRIIGFTPVLYEDELYYALSVSKNTKLEFYAAESLVFTNVKHIKKLISSLYPNKKFDFKNIWFSVFEYQHFRGVWIYFIGSAGQLNLHRLPSAYLSKQLVAIQPIDDNKIPEYAKEVFNSDTINKLIKDLDNINKQILKLRNPKDKDPEKHLKKLSELNILLTDKAKQIFEIGKLRVEKSVAGEFYRNQELCHNIYVQELN